jgi:acetylornithine deacetylase
MPELLPDRVSAITQAVAEGFDEQLAFTQKLIRFGGQRGNEHEIQDFIFQQYSERGYNPVKFEIDPEEISRHVGGGRVSATHSKAPIVVGVHMPRIQAEGGKSLILNGHVDVVPLGPKELWADDPYSARIDGDKLYGRGAGDMRAGVGIYFKAMDALQRIGLQPASKVVLESVVEEESTGNGTLMAHIKGYRADAALIPEPVGEALVRANVGVLWFQIEVKGKPVHVREMATGTNAIDACWNVIAALRELEKEWNERKIGSDLKIQDILSHKELEHPLSKSDVVHTKADLSTLLTCLT